MNGTPEWSSRRATASSLRQGWTIWCEHLLVSIIGGEDAGQVDWPDAVIKRAAEAGLSLDAEGNIVRAAP